MYQLRCYGNVITNYINYMFAGIIAMAMRNYIVHWLLGATYRYTITLNNKLRYNYL